MVDQILNRGENHEVIQQGAGREAEVLPGLLGIFLWFLFWPQPELYWALCGQQSGEGWGSLISCAV